MLTGQGNTKMITISEDEFLSLKKRADQGESEIRDLQSQLVILQQQLANFQRMLFGSKSERFTGVDSNQLSLDLGVLPQIEPEVQPEKISQPRKKDKSTHARAHLPENLPRVEEIITPDEDITGWKKIGEVRTEILEKKPAEFYVRVIVRGKYLSPDGKRIVIADLPNLPVHRGNVGEGLMSEIIISKWVDHSPIYRQRKTLVRQGIVLAESTMNGWIGYVLDKQVVLYESMVASALGGDYLQVDETTMPVLTKDKPGSTHKGYFWAGHSPPKKIAFFLYDKSRAAKVPKEFLSDFEGAVQCDAYAGYNFLNEPDWAKKTIKLGCFAHCRRYFEKSLSGEPENAKEIMLAIQKLYQVERIARNHKLSHGQIKDLRQRFSVKILDAIHTRLKEHLPHILPKRDWGKAIQYALRNWDELCRYTENGKWNIDNNTIENNIRPVALGRRNFLFAGSHDAAQRSAMIYTFMATCKINNVNPYHWLKWVMVTLPDTKMSELENLFPSNFAKSHPEIEPVKS
mgnify:CR=1 FL=1